jgi:hypothetical protein
MNKIFTSQSPFVTEDNRRFRPQLKTTADLLNVKHEALLPEPVVRGATVLDLGSCIGATGYWVSRLGGASYLGVEHQEGYVQTARRLLADMPRCAIQQDTAEEFLLHSSGRFDIVCLLGIAHGVYDPLALIRSAASRADKYLCFDDMGWNTDDPALIVDPIMKMPLAGEKAATVGFGWFISPAAMEAIVKFLGFAPEMPPKFTHPKRWMCRYRRIGGEGQEASFSTQTVAWPAE